MDRTSVTVRSISRNAFERCTSHCRSLRRVPRRLPFGALVIAIAMIVATPVVVAAHVAPSAAPAQRVAVQPHAAFDDTTEPAPLHWLRGTPVAPVAHPKIALVRDPAFHGLATGGAARRDPEILGFAQSGEVTSGSWSSDLNFSLLSTIAYAPA